MHADIPGYHPYFRVLCLIVCYFPEDGDEEGEAQEIPLPNVKASVLSKVGTLGGLQRNAKSRISSRVFDVLPSYQADDNVQSVLFCSVSFWGVHSRYWSDGSQVCAGSWHRSARH